MIGCLRTRDHKQPIIALYFESEPELKFYNLEARPLWQAVVLEILELLFLNLQNENILKYFNFVTHVVH